jgi:hypothetical protein
MSLRETNLLAVNFEKSLLDLYGQKRPKVKIKNAF